MSFKTGDRIEGNGEVDGVDITGMKGTVKKTSALRQGVFNIEFDKTHQYFHNCNGDTKDGHGYHIPKENLLYIFEGKTKLRFTFLEEEETTITKPPPRPDGYKRTSEGFLTNEDNWKPGKWLC